MDNVNPSLSRGTIVRRIAGTAGFFAVAIGAAGYIFLAGTQRELNPVRAYQAERQQVQAADDKQKRYGALVNQLFGEQGLADTNGDRAYSFEELVNAYRRMGPRFQDRVYYVSEFEANH